MKQNQLLNIALGLVIAFGSAVPTKAQDMLQYIDLNSDEFTKSDMTRAEIEAAIAAEGAVSWISSGNASMVSIFQVST